MSSCTLNLIWYIRFGKFNKNYQLLNYNKYILKGHFIILYLNNFWLKEASRAYTWLNNDNNNNNYSSIINCMLFFFSFQERIAVLLGGADKVDAHHVTSCVSYCKEKYTLWRADIRKKVHTVLTIINPLACKGYEVLFQFNKMSRAISFQNLVK